MGKLTHLMIHCSDTPSTFFVERSDIEQWHIKERGWSKVGYSTLFLRDGSTDILIPWDRDALIDWDELSNGASGWNGTAKHFCYAGGRGKNGGAEDNRTGGQHAAMEAPVKLFLMLWPDVKLIGHNQVNKVKYCPSFDVPAWAKSIGISEKNIDPKIYY
jgi:N-acetylmuramoyl-L-alanine amidase